MKYILIISTCISFTVISCRNKSSFVTRELSEGEKQSIGIIINADTNDSVRTHYQNVSFKKNGIVTDASDASKLAYIYLTRVYGVDKINDQLPLKVSSFENYWFIEGTFNHTGDGGVAEILICKTDGRAIHISHTK